MMKATFFAILFGIPLLASLTFAEDLGAPGCGDPAAKFAVKTAKDQRTVQPEAGKALIYFIEDDSNFESFPKPTTRMGVDGQWVGANHGDSYFFVQVAPGVHHLCASWQTTVIVGKGHQTAAAHFTADAGGVYYFEVKNKWIRDHGVLSMSLDPVDSDEGQLLANKFSFSTSERK